MPAQDASLSSDDDLHDIDDGSNPEISRAADASKRRKILRACDVCRRKKIRCDAHSHSRAKCSHCVTYKLDCTFNEGAKKRGPPKGYIDDLEKRCELLEQLVNRIAPHLDLTEEVGPSFNKETWINVKGAQHGRGVRSMPGVKPSMHSPNVPYLPPSPKLPNGFPHTHQGLPIHEHTREVNTLNITTSLDSDEERNYTHNRGVLTKHIETQMESLKLNGFDKRFHGKSSGVTLVQVAMNLKEEVTGANPETVRTVFNMRPQFWRPNPWEWMTSSKPCTHNVQFPPDDLAENLVDLCFKNVMIHFPVLHRPTFDSQRRAEAFKRDSNFARVYLLVCAVGSRFSNDERVCFTTADKDVQWNSAGWTWFAQVMALKKPILATAGLSDLQSTALSALYLQGTSAPHASWLLAGVGLRFAQDIGAHREKVYGADHPFENQMWKRAFWCLVAIDRMTSAGLGRPISVFDEDIDVDLPLEVDDENYDEVKKQWLQPEGKPSRLTAFNHYVKLQGILAYAIRTIYSINKSKVHLGFVGPEWESHTVAELDSALNSWLDSIPDHLRWDPSCQDRTFFQQAALLRMTYHYVQITIHRPFIPVLATSSRPSPLGFPSLAICTNAARAASHVLEAMAASDAEITPFVYVIAFTVGTILIISIWGVKKNNLKVDLSSQVADVHRCIRVLHKAEKRWHTAGRLCDIMSELLSANDVPLPQTSPTPPDTTRKRDRDEDTPDTAWSESTDDSTKPSYVPAPLDSLTSSLDQSVLIPSPPAGSSRDLGTHVQPMASTFASDPGSLPVTFDLGNSWTPSQSSGGPEVTMMEPSWDNYHLAGPNIPGMNPGLQRITGLSIPGTNGLQGLLSPNSLFQEFLGSFDTTSGGSAQSAASYAPEPSVWDPATNTDWSWMGDASTNLFASPPGPSGSR